MIPASYLEEIIAHLEVVGQLAMEIRGQADESGDDLNDKTSKLLNAVVKSVLPVLPLLQSEKYRFTNNMSRPVTLRGIKLEIGEFKPRYTNFAGHQHVILTVQGKIAYEDQRFKPSDPWYFLYYEVGRDPLDRVDFLAKFTKALKEVIKNNEERLRASSEETDVENAKLQQVLDGLD